MESQAIVNYSRPRRISINWFDSADGSAKAYVGDLDKSGRKKTRREFFYGKSIYN